METVRNSKTRKRKVSKGQTYSARRRADRAARARRRTRAARREQLQRHFKFRVKVVRTYRQYRAQGVPEAETARRTLARWQPTRPEHFPLCLSSIRQWHRAVGQRTWAALRPQSTRPKHLTYQVPELVVGLIFTLRTLLGWGGHRIAAELSARGIANFSGHTIYKVMARLGLPVALYALKGQSAGIAYRRYEKKRGNAQWHIDLKHTRLADGTRVYICVLVDDYSRYAVAAVAGTAASSEWVAQVAQQSLRHAGCPAELVSDNGREFVSAWEACLTAFGRLLAANDIEHLNCAPYYPQGNGKAEAFIQIVSEELLTGRTFESLADLQVALDKFLTYYNNYRLHSALGWQTPASRYTGRKLTIRGLAGLSGVEGMAANPHWGDSYCDPPIEITPETAARARALTLGTMPAN